MPGMSRLMLIAGLILTCWLGMMLVHESGHVFAAVLSGGRVTHLEWPPWGFSRTDVAPNPHPLVVAWAGPLVGAVLPLVASLILRGIKRRSLVAEIFSAFCLLANGIYLSAGTLGRVGDTGDILRNGSPFWLLWAVGIAFSLASLAQFHALGPRLGIPGATKSQTIGAALLGALLVVASSLWQLLP
jgi:hypothetical protein